VSNFRELLLKVDWTESAKGACSCLGGMPTHIGGEESEQEGDLKKAFRKRDS